MSRPPLLRFFDCLSLSINWEALLTNPGAKRSFAAIFWYFFSFSLSRCACSRRTAFVLASSVSFAPPHTAGLTHFAARPLPTGPASLGSGQVSFDSGWSAGRCAALRWPSLRCRKFHIPRPGLRPGLGRFTAPPLPNKGFVLAGGPKAIRAAHDGSALLTRSSAPPPGPSWPRPGRGPIPQIR